MYSQELQSISESAYMHASYPQTMQHLYTVTMKGCVMHLGPLLFPVYCHLWYIYSIICDWAYCHANR